jgi:hypothetical protein
LLLSAAHFSLSTFHFPLFHLYFDKITLENSATNFMKLKFITRYSFAILMLAFGIAGIACNNSGSGTNSIKGTPTESYKKLYEAVKSKNTEAIRAMMSKQTQGFAQGAAQRQNIPVEKVLENGFTATTFSPTMPEIRDERIKDGFGAVEVYNSKDKIWEDLPFVAEDGTWKLAIGDLFANTFKTPGKGRAVLEMEAANAAGNIPVTILNTNGMGNFKTGERPKMPSDVSNSNSNTNAAKK